MKLSVLVCTLILSICLPSEFPKHLNDDILHHRRVPFSEKELTVTSLLSCVLIFISRIYGIHLIVIIILSSRLRTLSKRARRARRTGDDAAARQPSYRRALSFQRLKCVRVTTKAERSHFHQPSPRCLSLSSHILHWNIRHNRVATFCLFPFSVYSICLYLSLELLED